MLDYLGIFKELNKKKIKYLVVGGLAVNLYGIPRMTYDIDLLLSFDDDNMSNFLKLIKIWEFKPKVPANILDLKDENKRNDWIKNKNMKAFCLVNPAWAIAEIDILIQSPVDYQTAIKHCRRIGVKDISVPVISIKDLIKMKQASDRLQDKEDVKNLRRIIADEKE
ncbi:MAG: hypothetical protein PHF95_00155 [bacterium]|nr:hypothetical protein [bacterium]